MLENEIWQKSNGGLWTPDDNEMILGKLKRRGLDPSKKEQNRTNFRLSLSKTTEKIQNRYISQTEKALLGGRFTTAETHIVVRTKTERPNAKLHRWKWGNLVDEEHQRLVCRCCPQRHTGIDLNLWKKFWRMISYLFCNLRKRNGPVTCYSHCNCSNSRQNWQ